MFLGWHPALSACVCLSVRTLSPSAPSQFLCLKSLTASAFSLGPSSLSTVVSVDFHLWVSQPWGPFLSPLGFYFLWPQCPGRRRKGLPREGARARARWRAQLLSGVTYPMLSSTWKGLTHDLPITGGCLFPLRALSHLPSLTSVLLLCCFCRCHPHPRPPPMAQLSACCSFWAFCHSLPWPWHWPKASPRLPAPLLTLGYLRSFHDHWLGVGCAVWLGWGGAWGLRRQHFGGQGGSGCWVALGVLVLGLGCRGCGAS